MWVNRNRRAWASAARGQNRHRRHVAGGQWVSTLDALGTSRPGATGGMGRFTAPEMLALPVARRMARKVGQHVEVWWSRTSETNGRDFAVALFHALAVPCRPAQSAMVCHGRMTLAERLRRSAAPGPQCPRSKSAVWRKRRGAGAALPTRPRLAPD